MADSEDAVVITFLCKLATLPNICMHMYEIDLRKGLTNNISLFFISSFCYLYRSVVRTNQASKMELFAKIVKIMFFLLYGIGHFYGHYLLL